jgi:hypothetical protein
MSSLLAILMILIALLSFVPVSYKNGWRTPSLFLPIAGLGLAAVYELAVRTEVPAESVPIRIDLLFGRPIVAFILLMGVCRWTIFLYAKRSKEDHRRNHALTWQLVSLLVVLSVLAVWTRPHWDAMGLILETLIHK